MNLVAALGEPGVGALTFVETVFPLLPSDAVLPLSGFLAQQGQLSLTWVLVAATLGSLAGEWSLYGLGAALGRDRAFDLLPRLPGVDREDVERASGWFERCGAWVVFFSRFVPGAGALAPVSAGAQRMPPLVFTASAAVGSLSWNAGVVGLGYALPGRWEAIGDWAGAAGTAAFGVLALCAAVALVHRCGRRE